MPRAFSGSARRNFMGRRPAPSSAAWPLPIDLVVSVTAYGGDAREDNNSAGLVPKALTMNRSLPVSLRFHSLSIRKRAMVVTCSG